MSAGSVWASLARLLPDFRCVLVDRPGCGLSAAPNADLRDRAGLEAYGDAMVVEVLDALAIERADVVATSFGGYFVLRAAAARPGRFGHVVEMGFPVGAPMLHVPPLMRLSSVPGLGSLAARMPVNERVVRRMLRQAGLRRAIDTGRLDQVALDWCVSLLRDTDTMRNEVGVARLVVLPIRGANTDVVLGPELLARITTPVTLLWGDDDPFGGVDTAERFAAQLPNARLEMAPGAGHAPWVDDPERAAGVVRAALSE
jgi:pimeloyl-ACP methyl ester carboxylesterase